MDSSMIPMLVSFLGPALWEVFKVLLEKGRDLALEKGAQPLKEWIDKKYDDRKDAQALSEAILEALDTLKRSGQFDRYDSLFATLKLTGLDRKTQLELAGAAVEMTQSRPEIISADLLVSLGIDENENNRFLLASFLFYLRRALASVSPYREGIDYANEIDKLGYLRGISSQMGAVAEKLEAILSLEQTLMAERHLTDKDAEALKDYLKEVRQKWEGLMLPMLRKKSGVVTNAKLEQVFVPLKIRDYRAEEKARQAMTQSQRKATEGREEEIQPVEIGDLLNRYTRFILIGPPGCGKTTLLNRVALAFAMGSATEDLKWKGGKLLPVYLRLRNFGAFLKEQRHVFPEPCAGSVVAYLENQFRRGERITLSADFFDKRLLEGNCIVLMDGLDEVSERRDEVARHIVSFVEKYGNHHNNRFGMASRPRGYESVEVQLRPLDLAVAEVNPLNAQGIRQLIDNLLKLIEEDQAKRADDLDKLVRAILASDELTKIAGIPLFCAALVQVYKYHGANLPNRRVDVLDEIVNLLLGFWHYQQTHLSEAEQLAMEDGTGKQYREVKDAVAAKYRRLSHLADYMQQKLRQAQIRFDQAVDVLIKHFQERERIADEGIAHDWAEKFLINSHERSGLLVEREPEIYEFLHKGFLEYFAASALVNQSKTMTDVLLDHVNDSWWEEVILLAGAHPKTPEGVQVELVTRMLEQAEILPYGSDEHLRHLLIAGGLARDMSDLPRQEHEWVEQALYHVAVDGTLKPSQRASAADALDELGYLPEDLYDFIAIPDDEAPEFFIAKYPVTNLQYERFLKSGQFAERQWWVDFPMFDKNSRRVTGRSWGEQGWEWLQAALKDKDNPVREGVLYPRSWDDPRFGIARKTATVVGVTWYEANAYCKWLAEQRGLPEWRSLGRLNRGGAQLELRLPSDAEWVEAAGGEAGGRFAWGALKDSEEEVIRYANTEESGIGRTTPVWMYPQGKSPRGVMELSGNVWEWQANFWDKDHNTLSFRGGSWRYDWHGARVATRDYISPSYSWDEIGFRLFARPV